MEENIQKILDKKPSQQQLTILKNRQEHLLILMQAGQSTAQLEKELEEVERQINELEAKMLLDVHKKTPESSNTSINQPTIVSTSIDVSSKEISFKVDETYWYSDQDINQLLNLLVADKKEANILLAPNHDDLLIESLKRAVGIWEGKEEDSGNVDPNLSSLLPLNINHESQMLEVNQGNHWVGIVIKPVSEHKYDIVYVDSKEYKISETLKTIIKSVLKEKIRKIESVSILQ